MPVWLGQGLSRGRTRPPRLATIPVSKGLRDGCARCPPNAGFGGSADVRRGAGRPTSVGSRTLAWPRVGTGRPCSVSPCALAEVLRVVVHDGGEEGLRAGGGDVHLDTKGVAPWTVSSNPPPGTLRRSSIGRAVVLYRLDGEFEPTPRSHSSLAPGTRCPAPGIRCSASVSAHAAGESI